MWKWGWGAVLVGRGSGDRDVEGSGGGGGASCELTIRDACMRYPSSKLNSNLLSKLKSKLKSAELRLRGCDVGAVLEVLFDQSLN